MNSITKKLIAGFSLVFLAGLLPGVALAEQQSSCLKLKELQTEYDAAAKNVGTTWQIKFKTHDCHLPVTPPFSQLSMETEPRSGFDLRIYSSSYDKAGKPANGAVGQTAEELNLTILVTPGAELAPGSYKVPAVLKYQAIDDKGNVLQENTSVMIPVKVVASAAEVHFKSHRWKTAGEVALIVVLIPVMIAEGIFQMITGVEIFPTC